RIVDEAGLLACAMYVDLNPVRAAIAESPEEAEHTSAYDRSKARRGAKIPSAAFDLKPVSTEEAGKKIRDTPVDQLRKDRTKKKRNPTGRKIKRDGWLSPLTLDARTLASDPEAHADGCRSSDKGFLHVSWEDYWELLKWTAKQSVRGAVNVPNRIAKRLTELGIEATMWRDLVWDWQRYFGKSVCIGRPDSIKQHAEDTGQHHHRGQASVKACFTC
ncbi:MAG: hypothetical protein AAGG48_24080, partial [Planctomycetota bacterium]